MLWAGLIEMPPVSKVTPFPPAPPARCPFLVLEHDEARLFGAPLGDGQERAHLLADDRRLVEDGDLEAVALGEILRRLSQKGRRTDIAGQHLEPAGEALARADRGAHPVPGFDLRGRVRRQDGETRQRWLLIFRRLLHLGEDPRPLSQPLRRELAGVAGDRSPFASAARWNPPDGTPRLRARLATMAAARRTSGLVAASTLPSPTRTIRPAGPLGTKLSSRPACR